MRLVIQRVTQASVTVSGSVVGAINKGYLVLVGIGQNDTEAIVEKMADKMMRLRIFSDENDFSQVILLQPDLPKAFAGALFTASKKYDTINNRRRLQYVAKSLASLFIDHPSSA